MPDAATIAVQDLPAWIERLLQRGRVVAPVLTPHGDTAFATVERPGEVLWEFDNPLGSPKRFLLPQTDPLLHVRKNGGITLEPVPEHGHLILFNVRSCDAKGLRYLAAVYARDLPDAGLARRAGRTTVVNLACTTPCAEGFCACCDAGPFLAEGFDLQLAPLGERVLAEPGSPAGQALVDAAAPLFRPATPAELAQRGEAEAAAHRAFGAETCHFGSAMRRVSTGRVPAALWDRMGDWCLGCGACTMVCPVCYCFSVRDRAEPEGGWTRCRLWDSCQYSSFTLEASGHNPRQERSDRIKRRFFHKVSAQYFQRDGAVGCVGCGRCIQACYGGTDMPAGVAAIRSGAWHD